ncbi:DUF2079 domain-containing protein [Streptococcus dentapri]|uniref:DUF2079 domain-containing protein n=1 Tax=Streptococcus dentapri TaxID=573564 RepID=A0ABV8D2S0_9STRE
MARRKEEGQTYHRRHRVEDKFDVAEAELQRETPKSYKIKIDGLHRFYIFILSLILALTSVANPLLTDFGNIHQTVNLYTGQMMANGHIPYLDTFATGGFLFYVIIALSYLLGSSIWLMIIELLAFYMSGIYLYKIIAFLTNRHGMGMTFTVIFFLLNLGFGFGGLYPIQWAFPFLLNALWYLTKYFAGHINDEAFIIYAIFGSISALIEPRSLIFGALSFLAIGIYNFMQRHFARGFYQLLCMIFGAILVYYTVGYFIFNMGNLSDYISQALFYNFKVFTIGKESFLITIPYQILILASSGLLLGFFGFWGHLGQTSNFKTIKWLIFWNLVFSLVIGIFARSYYIFQLLLVLPFGLILTALVINDNIDYQRAEPSSKGSRAAHRRKHSREANRSYWGTFAEKHFQLPVLVVIAGVVLPIFIGIMSLGLNSERSNIAAYLRENTDKKNTIYVWDNSSKIYLDTALQSASQFPVPSVNTTTKANAQKLEDEILQARAQYIVVNNSENLSSDIVNRLNSTYEKISVTDADHFTVYQKK